MSQDDPSDVAHALFRQLSHALATSEVHIEHIGCGVYQATVNGRALSPAPRVKAIDLWVAEYRS